MFFLVLFSFLSGLATILAPCVWPLLPIILSATTTGGRRKPLGIVTGISVAFLFATLGLAYLIKVIPFDPEVLRTAGVVVIGCLGLALLIPVLGRWLEGGVSRLTNFSGRFLRRSGEGFESGFVIGAALGLVWSPCAGPILGTVATLAATQAVDLAVVALAVAFVVGIAVPLYLLAFVGQRLLVGTRQLAPYTGIIQRVFGGVMLLAAGVIYTGYDKVLQTKLIETYPACGLVLNSLEGNPRVLEALRDLRTKATNSQAVGDQVESIAEPIQVPDPTNAARLPVFSHAPTLAGLSGWLNTNGRALSLEGLQGQVTLVHFWTLGCANCLRTLPTVTAWYEQYKAAGLVVLGIHTPEFAYEHDPKNVAQALRQHGITYPVAQDNDFATWQAFGNQYWPTLYLVDALGQVRYTHFGEGQYAETQSAIELLLKEAQATQQ